MKEPIIGIIGGKGKMGTFFKNFFEQNGFEVIISDIGTKLSNEWLVKKVDAVIFSVPISKIVKVIESVIKFTRKEQILMDITSIKKPAIASMLKSDCEVLGLHPMFGPTVDLKGQTMVVCKARERERTTLFLRLFQKAGIKLKESTVEEHDIMMAVIQGMTHFNAIVLGHAMMNLNINIKKTLEFTSPVYKMRLAMVGRILAQNPELYADIELENPGMDDVIKAMEESNNVLMQIIKTKDKKRFISYFKKAADFFGNFKEEAMSQTDKLIKVMEDG